MAWAGARRGSAAFFSAVFFRNAAASRSCMGEWPGGRIGLSSALIARWSCAPYRSAHDKTPVATISADRIKAKDANSLPDLVRLAKANGWTSLKINGDEEFKRAAYLAASAQGIRIDGYKPDEKTKAAADREQARQAAAAPTKEQAPRTSNQARDNKEQADPAKDLAERFRRQTDVQNAKDPDLKRAQSHVAQVNQTTERSPRRTTARHLPC